MDTQALWLTLRLALITTALLMLIALPLARWIAGGTGGVRAVVQAVVALPLVLPPTVLGFSLPLAGPSLVTAAVLTFTHTVGEFGVVLMLGGNIPGATRTLSIALYDQVQDFNYAAANRTAGLLLAFSLATLIVIYWRGAERRPLLG